MTPIPRVGKIIKILLLFQLFFNEFDFFLKNEKVVYNFYEFAWTEQFHEFSLENHETWNFWISESALWKDKYLSVFVNWDILVNKGKIYEAGSFSCFGSDVSINIWEGRSLFRKTVHFVSRHDRCQPLINMYTAQKWPRPCLTSSPVMQDGRYSMRNN